jgi:radical SAM superfamily enzyme YgiQ (UPF0313 family)
MNMRPMDTHLKTQMSPSLALLTLISLTPANHEVILINENIERLDLHGDADLVGITVTLDVMPRACEISEAFQRRGVPVVAGGIHISSCPEECLSYFNAICVGAAERVWERIIHDVERGCLQKVYQDMQDFQGNEIVSPAYNRIDTRQYLYTNVVTTSRGCPNRCDFCYNSCEHRMYIRRPIEDVLKDIESLGTRHILFIDDNFIGSPEYTRELLGRMKNKHFVWSAAVTTRILDLPDILDLMAETGCQSLFIGFESVNDSSLKSVHKNNQVARYAALVEAVHSRGIMINASMVFGLDGDTPDVFRTTLDWLVEHRIETLTSHILTPYPGTALYKRIEAAGRILDRDLGKYNTAHVVFQPKGMTEEELYDGYLWMYRQFYSFGNILRRLPRTHRQRMPYLLFNFFYRKFGKLTSLVAKIIPMQILGRFARKMAYHIG